MRAIKVLMISVLLATLLLINVPVQGARSAANPSVLPPTARVQGKTLGEWGAEQWRVEFGIPASVNPALGNPWPTCYFDRIGNVAIGVGYAFSGESECEMPAGMFLYVIVIGTECSTAEPPPFYGANEEELRACAQTMAAFENIEADVDGVAIHNIEEYRAISPLYQFTLPSDNFLGALAGTYDSVAENIAFMLAPMSPGEHTIHVHGEIPTFGFFYDWVYNITVTP